MTRVLFFLGIFGVSQLAQAAFYDFTLEGVVTNAQHTDVNVGDRFTIRYTATSQDTSPNPTGGVYPATPAIVTFPNTSVTWPSYVRVALASPPDFDVVNYGFTGESPFEEFMVGVWFPGGTLPSDALPLTLPLQSATAARLHWLGLSGVVDGNITSYVSVEVPEPYGACLLWLMLALETRGNRRRRVRV
jgi:hypothetical protein